MGLGEFLFKVISFKIDFFTLFNHCVRKFGAAFLCLRFPWVVYKNFVAHKSNYFLVFNFSFSNPLYHMYQLVRALRDWPISVVSRILKHSLLQLMFFDTDFLPMSATSPSKFANAYKTYGLWVDWMGREKSLTFLLPITPCAPALGRGLAGETWDEPALTASVHR